MDDEPVALSTLLLQGEDMIVRLADAHASWGLGTAQQWDLDQRTGVITWTFADRVASAPAQIIGSHNPATESWLWAWANTSILPEMSRDARAVRDWAVRHEQSALIAPELTADADTAATLTALAVRITGATGLYRGAGGGVVPIITFGQVTLTGADGRTTTFDPDAG
jgi:hypothetical protein